MHETNAAFLNLPSYLQLLTLGLALQAAALLFAFDVGLCLHNTSAVCHRCLRSQWCKHGIPCLKRGSGTGGLDERDVGKGAGFSQATNELLRTKWFRLRRRPDRAIGRSTL
jgi:hypothetical protein